MSSPYLAHPTGTFIHISELQKIKSEFTLKNLKKVKAIRMGKVWVNQKFLKSGKPNKSYMPDTIECFKVSKSPQWIQIPPGKRSFIPFESHYANQVIEFPDTSIILRDYQEKAINKMLEQKVGMVKSGAGSGKTIIVIEAMRKIKRKTLIVTKDLTLMTQMVRDIQNIMGITPVQISGEVYSKKKKEGWDNRITVMSIDSRNKLTDTESYGAIFFDEAHTYFSDNRREWVGSLSPEYMFGLTATPQVNDMSNDVFNIYFGKEIVTEGIEIHTPNYTQVLSSFNFQIDDVNTQFHELKSALYESPTRNKLIADLVKEKIAGRKGLVFCEYVEHAKTIKQMLESMGIRSYLMIGAVSKEDREKIREEVMVYNGDCIIIGSVEIIGTGFNLPELSLAVLTAPIKFESKIEQFVGRLSRPHPTKPSAMFYDIVDNLQPILNRQSISRIRTYRATYKEGKTFIKT